MKKRMVTFLAVVTMMVCASSTWAAPLTPGSSVAPSIVSSAPAPWGGLTFVDQMNSAYASPAGPNSFSGTLHTIVYKEAGGTLDFWYQVTADKSSGYIERLSIPGYGNFSTDVSLVTTDTSLLPSQTGGTLGTKGYSAVTRYSADVIGGNFDGALFGGQSTNWLVVRTNSTSYSKTTAYIQDGNQATATSFSPAPLPSSFVLFGTGILGFAGGWVRRIRKCLGVQV
jgi:hypothetical protein